MERAFAAMHQANQRRTPFQIEFGRHDHTVSLFLRFPKSLRPYIETPIVANYPNIRLARIDDDALDCPPGYVAWSQSVHLRPDFFPINRAAELENDPLADLLAALAPGNNDPTHPRIILRLHPHPSYSLRRRALKRAIRILDRPLMREYDWLADYYRAAVTHRRRFVRFLAWLAGFGVPRGRGNLLIDSTAQKGHSREDMLQAAMLKAGSHLFTVHLQLVVYAPKSAKRKAHSKLAELLGALGPFTLPMFSTFHASKCVAGEPRPVGRGFLLSNSELASLFHPATLTIQTSRMEQAAFQELEAPANLPASGKGEGICEIGEVAFRSQATRFGIQLDDRRRHLAIVGKTGMGKSTLLKKMLVDDMHEGRGVGLIDPHGDLAEESLHLVPRARTSDVVYFDAGDTVFPVAYNPLQCRSDADRPLVASGIVSSFKKLYGDSWGPRLEHIFRNTLLGVLFLPDATLVSVLRMLNEKPFRQQVIGRIADPIVRSFWLDEFNTWNDRFRTEAIAPVQNKLGHFLSNPILRAIVSPPKGTLDLRSCMDGGKIVIINLSKGRIGEDACSLLGSFLVTGLQLAAMSRAELPEAKRRDFFLAIDEFQNFATDSFASILSEARKYRLSLTLAHQYLRQVDETTRDAVFGNVGSVIAFQVGPDDAKELACQLSKYEDQIVPSDLLSLPAFTAYVRLLIEGMPSPPFSMKTIRPPRTHDQTRYEKVRSHSRRTFGSYTASQRHAA